MPVGMPSPAAFLRLLLLGALAAPAALRAQVSAEHLFQPGAVALSVMGGGAAFSPFQVSAVDAGAEVRPFERRIAPHTSTVLGAEVMAWITRSWGLRLHGSWAPSRFDVQLDAAGTERIRADGLAGDTTEWRGLDVWTGDVSALVRPHFSFGRMAPWAILGAGVVSWRPRGTGPLPDEAEAAFSGGRRTAAAAVVGLGAAVPLQREDFCLTFALTNHLTRTPISSPDRVRLTSNVRLLVGLTLPLGHQH